MPTLRAAHEATAVPYEPSQEERKAMRAGATALFMWSFDGARVREVDTDGSYTGQINDKLRQTCAAKREGATLAKRAAALALAVPYEPSVARRAIMRASASPLYMWSCDHEHARLVNTNGSMRQIL